jgi:feruloyl esterase
VARVAPSQITATKYMNDNPTQGVAFRRPLCVYPIYRAYQGGPKTAATSFACKPASQVRNQACSKYYRP